MNISPTIPLVLGLIAGILFIGVFIAAWIVTFRNRHRIKKYSSASHKISTN